MSITDEQRQKIGSGVVRGLTTLAAVACFFAMVPKRSWAAGPLFLTTLDNSVATFGGYVMACLWGLALANCAAFSPRYIAIIALVASGAWLMVGIAVSLVADW